MYNYIQFHGTKYKIALVPCVYYDSLTHKSDCFYVTLCIFAQSM